MRRLEMQRRHARTLLASAMIATTLVAAGGCEWFRGITSSDGPPFPAAKDGATTMPVEDVTVQTSSGNVAGLVQPLSRPIAQGPLPLFYLVESPMTLRVTNADTGEEITTLDVKSPQILRVESRGIVVDGQVVLGARLAPGNYAIGLMSRDAGVVKTTQTRVTPTIPTRPAAASQPSPSPDATPPPAAEPASN